MSILEGFIQGIIQGFTEFLPVSSSGHLSLFQHFFGLSGEGALTFSLMLHIGTLVAVFVAFWSTIKDMIVEFFRMIGLIFTGKFKYSELNDAGRMIIMVLLSIVPLFAFYIFKDYLTAASEDNDILLEGVCFLYTSALLFIACRSSGEKTMHDMRPRDALAVGVFQGVAMLPGVSRSGSTISSTMILGFKRETAVQFSFIMGIPVILASALVDLKDTISTGVAFDWPPILVGMVTAAVFGYLSIKLVKWLIKDGKFKIFAYYTLILGVIVVIIGIIEKVYGQNFVEIVSAALK